MGVDTTGTAGADARADRSAPGRSRGPRSASPPSPSGATPAATQAVAATPPPMQAIASLPVAPRPANFAKHAGAGHPGAARPAGRHALRQALLGRRGPARDQAAGRVADPVAELEQAIGVRDLAIDAVDRADRHRRSAEVVQMAGEPGDEVRAIAAVRQVRAGLALLVGRRETADQRPQQRLAVSAPLAPLERPHALGQLGNAAGDLLAVGPGREPIDQRAHLPRLEPPAVAQQHHGPSPRRQRGEQVSSDPRLLAAAGKLVGRLGRIGDAADQLQRGSRLAPPPAQLLAGLVGDRGEHIAADLVVAEPPGAARQRAQGPDPGAGVDVVDLLGREGAPERAPDHALRRAPELLEQPPGTLVPALVAPARRRGSPQSGRCFDGLHPASLGRQAHGGAVRPPCRVAAVSWQRTIARFGPPMQGPIPPGSSIFRGRS